MKTQLEQALLSARDNGAAQTEVTHDGARIDVRVVSEFEAITVTLEAPHARFQEDVILEILGILGHPPDAVYNVRHGGTPTTAETMEAVWAHPEKDFADELKPVVPQILAPGHRILMVSDRLHRYLVPSHPEEWSETQTGVWQNFWELRLRDAPFREWITQQTDPKVWDYFGVIGKSMKRNLIAEHAGLGGMTPALQNRMENLFLSAAVTGFHLCCLHRRRQDLPLVSTVGKVDPEQMTARVLKKLSWESVPEGLAGVINEINITDIRESGELFARAVTMPPAVLDAMLSGANKCSVLGFVTAESVQGATDLN